MGFFSADEPKSYEIDGKKLTCQFCANTTFETRQEQLHTPTTTFLNLEWADKTATCFVCSRCGYIHWFLR